MPFPSKTTTIRVSRTTHELLAAEARQRRISVASLLADIARQRQKTAMWQSERRATQLDENNAAVAAEEQDWDAVTVDGLD